MNVSSLAIAAVLVLTVAVPTGGATHGHFEPAGSGIYLVFAHGAPVIESIWCESNGLGGYQDTPTLDDWGALIPPDIRVAPPDPWGRSPSQCDTLTP